MKNLIKLFTVVLMIAISFSIQSCDREKNNSFAVTETSNLYELDGGVVTSKMQSKENGQMIYSMNVKIDGRNEYVKITGKEYESFELGDTIKVVKEEMPEELGISDAPTTEGGYKIVTIGGENYLVIKLENNISINDTTNFK